MDPLALVTGYMYGSDGSCNIGYMYGSDGSCNIGYMYGSAGSCNRLHVWIRWLL
jgi:hypothetical protein